jgi:hypothetical protein
LVDRYWDALEYDFQVHLNGLRAMDWIEGKKDWREFYRLKAHLGRGTKYWAARLSDPQVIEMLAAEPEKRGRGGSTPDLEGWTPLMEALADIKDHLIAVRVAHTRSDPHSVQWSPRPVSPVAEMRDRRRQAKLTSSIERGKANYRRKKGVD